MSKIKWCERCGVEMRDAGRKRLCEDCAAVRKAEWAERNKLRYRQKKLKKRLTGMEALEAEVLEAEKAGMSYGQYKAAKGWGLIEMKPKMLERSRVCTYSRGGECQILADGKKSVVCDGRAADCSFYKTREQAVADSDRAIEICRQKELCKNCKYCVAPSKCKKSTEG